MTTTHPEAGGWLQRQSIERRLSFQAITAIVLGVLLIATTVIGSFYGDHMIERDNQLANEALKAALLEKDFASLERDTVRYALLQNAETEEGFRSNAADMQVSIDDARSASATSQYARLDEVEALTGRYVSVVETVIAGGSVDADDVAEIMESGNAVDAAIETVRDSSIARSAAITQEQRSAALLIMGITIAITLVVGAISYFLARALKKMIGGELSNIRAAIARIENGDLDGAIPYVARQDELGELARAAERLRDARRYQQAHEVETKRMIEEVGRGLQQVSDGDLMVEMPDLGEKYAALQADFNQAIGQLRAAMHSVAQSAGEVKTGALEISQASDDLAHRTESQAADLTRMTENVTSITAGMGEMAGSATEATDGVNAAVAEAQHGGEIVSRAVQAMDAIENSTTQIGQIIAVIDGLSFQTSLLALNAGVEAARAGEVGRGFAVVASEVRALAQRSSEAAEDIRKLISTSAEEVAGGVQLVRETGEALDRIIRKISDVTEIAAQISETTREQSEGLSDATSVMAGIDRMTQQNAAMVEQSTAAARSLANESDNLSNLVHRFRLGHPSRNQLDGARSRPAGGQVRAPASLGNLALVETDQNEDWSSF
ncbi:MAG: methyl-accepting chemotaxis protein [Erythrobacter sp.]